MPRRLRPDELQPNCYKEPLGRNLEAEKHYEPPGGGRMQVYDGLDFAKLAQFPEVKAKHWSPMDLIFFNFRTRDPREVNWYLYNKVGCRYSYDGKNYAFTSQDDPGGIYIPTTKVTLPAWNVVLPSEDQALTPEEKAAVEKAILDKVPGNYLPRARKVLWVLQRTKEAAQILEIIGVLGLLGGGAAVGSAMFVVGVLTLPLTPIMALIGWANAQTIGLRMNGMLAIAYGETAWTFSHLRPRWPLRLEENVRQSVSPTQFAEYRQRWHETVSDAMTRLGHAMRTKFPDVSLDVLKAAMQLQYGGGDDKECCQRILISFDAQFSGKDLADWREWRKKSVYPN